MENLECCPICANTESELFLECEDYTVSHEKFKIVLCTSCQFKYSNPRPSETEIGPYYKSDEYISHTNTSKGVVNLIYQQVRKYTLRKKFELVKRNSNGTVLLDYGAGAGIFLDYVKKQWWTAKGVEQDKETRENAIKKFYLDIISSDQIKTLQKEEFDVITLWHVLEHVHKLDETIKVLTNSLKQDGVLIIAVPNASSHDAKHYGKDWAAYDVPRHLYHFEPKDIEALFGNHGFDLVKILPMKFDSFYVSMLSEKYKGSTLSFFRGVIRGLISNLKAKSNSTYSSQIYLLKKNKAI